MNKSVITAFSLLTVALVGCSSAPPSDAAQELDKSTHVQSEALEGTKPARTGVHPNFCPSGFTTPGYYSFCDDGTIQKVSSCNAATCGGCTYDYYCYANCDCDGV